MRRREPSDLVCVIQTLEDKVEALTLDNYRLKRRINSLLRRMDTLRIHMKRFSLGAKRPEQNL